jgi:MFS family permease
MAALIGLILLSVETVYLYKALPETIHYRAEVEETGSSPEKKEELPVVSEQRRLLNMYALNRIMCVFSFIFSGMEFTLVFLTFDILDYSHMQQGKLLGFMGIVSALIQGGYVRRRVQKMGEKMIILQGMITCTIGLWCLASTVESDRPAAWLYGGVAFLAFTSGTVVNCLTSLASLQCHEDASKQNDSLSKGRALGEFRSFGQLGRAFGPISACSLYWVFGPEICYAAGTVAMLATTWFCAAAAPNKIKKKRVAKAKTQ